MYCGTISLRRTTTVRQIIESRGCYVIGFPLHLRFAKDGFMTKVSYRSCDTIVFVNYSFLLKFIARLVSQKKSHAVPEINVAEVYT